MSNHSDYEWGEGQWECRVSPVILRYFPKWTLLNGGIDSGVFFALRFYCLVSIIVIPLPFLRTFLTCILYFLSIRMKMYILQSLFLHSSSFFILFYYLFHDQIFFIFLHSPQNVFHLQLRPGYGIIHVIPHDLSCCPDSRFGEINKEGEKNKRK